MYITLPINVTNNAEDYASTCSFLKSDIITDKSILFVQSDTPPKKFITNNIGKL